MRLRKFAAVLLVLTITTPAFAARRSEEPSLYDRIAKVIRKLVLPSLVTNGDGLIPPIPGPKP